MQCEQQFRAIGHAYNANNIFVQNDTHAMRTTFSCKTARMQCAPTRNFARGYLIPKTYHLIPSAYHLFNNAFSNTSYISFTKWNFRPFK